MIGAYSRLDPIVEKCFLEAVEKTNLPREDTVCVDLCNEHKSTLGEPGTKVRRDIQEHWKNLKRRKIRSYASYLKKWSVAKGEATSLGVTDRRCSESHGVTDRIPPTVQTPPKLCLR